MRLDLPPTRHLHTESFSVWCSTFGALGAAAGIQASSVSKKGRPSIESASSGVWCTGRFSQIGLVGELALIWVTGDHSV